LKSLNSWS